MSIAAELVAVRRGFGGKVVGRMKMGRGRWMGGWIGGVDVARFKVQVSGLDSILMGCIGAECVFEMGSVLDEFCGTNGISPFAGGEGWQLAGRGIACVAGVGGSGV